VSQILPAQGDRSARLCRLAEVDFVVLGSKDGCVGRVKLARGYNKSARDPMEVDGTEQWRLVLAAAESSGQGKVRLPPAKTWRGSPVSLVRRQDS